MPEIPDTIVLRRHRDLVGRRHEIWYRRALLGLLGVFLALGLANVFGQSPSTERGSSPGAALRIVSPSAVRGGLMYQAQFDIKARREIKNAILVLNSGWLQGLTINTIEPSPSNQGSRNGSLVLELGHVPAGKVYSLYIQYQVNPITVGSRTQVAELSDGKQLLLRVRHPLTVFP